MDKMDNKNKINPNYGFMDVHEIANKLGCSSSKYVPI